MKPSTLSIFSLPNITSSSALFILRLSKLVFVALIFEPYYCTRNSQNLQMNFILTTFILDTQIIYIIQS